MTTCGGCGVELGNSDSHCPECGTASASLARTVPLVPTFQTEKLPTSNPEVSSNVAPSIQRFPEFSSAQRTSQNSTTSADATVGATSPPGRTFDVSDTDDSHAHGRKSKKLPALIVAAVVVIGIGAVGALALVGKAKHTEQVRAAQTSSTITAAKSPVVRMPQLQTLPVGVAISDLEGDGVNFSSNPVMFTQGASLVHPSDFKMNPVETSIPGAVSNATNIYNRIIKGNANVANALRLLNGFRVIASKPTSGVLLHPGQLVTLELVAPVAPTTTTVAPTAPPTTSPPVVTVAPTQPYYPPDTQYYPPNTQYYPPDTQYYPPNTW